MCEGSVKPQGVSLSVAARLSQNLANLPYQAVTANGFWMYAAPAVKIPRAHDGVSSVAGHEQHLCLGPLAAELFGELAAAHSRHHKVREEKVDSVNVSRGGIQCGSRRWCLQNGEPVSARGFASRLP